MKARLGLLTRLDTLSPWTFTGSVYALRWLVIIPLSYVQRLFGPTGTRMVSASPVVGLIVGVLVDPLIETLIECALPYWLMRQMRLVPGDKKPWGFIIVSAAIMTVLHIGAWPEAILPAMVTGGFLAYVYGHFASRKPAQAILHTWAFHAGINIVGWTLTVFF